MAKVGMISRLLDRFGIQVEDVASRLYRLCDSFVEAQSRRAEHETARYLQSRRQK